MKESELQYTMYCILYNHCHPETLKFFCLEYVPIILEKLN